MPARNEDVTYTVGAQGTMGASYVDPETGTRDDDESICGVTCKHWPAIAIAGRGDVSRAQDAAIPQGAVNINLPDNSPLSLIPSHGGFARHGARRGAGAGSAHAARRCAIAAATASTA